MVLSTFDRRSPRGSSRDAGTLVDGADIVFHFAGQGALIAGDALCTWNPLTGRPGPQIMPGAFSFSNDQALESLGRIEGIEAGALLVGHGDPWTAGVGAAVARAREAGTS